MYRKAEESAEDSFGRAQVARGRPCTQTSGCFMQPKNAYVLGIYGSGMYYRSKSLWEVVTAIRICCTRRNQSAVPVLVPNPLSTPLSDLTDGSGEIPVLTLTCTRPVPRQSVAGWQPACSCPLLQRSEPSPSGLTPRLARSRQLQLVAARLETCPINRQHSNTYPLKTPAYLLHTQHNTGDSDMHIHQGIT